MPEQATPDTKEQADGVSHDALKEALARQDMETAERIHRRLNGYPD